MQSSPAQLPLADLVEGLRVKQRIAVDDDFSLLRRFQKVETAQQGRFAGAGGTDDRQHLALLQRKTDIFENLGFAEALLNVFYLQH